MCVLSPCIYRELHFDRQFLAVWICRLPMCIPMTQDLQTGSCCFSPCKDVSNLFYMCFAFVAYGQYYSLYLIGDTHLGCGLFLLSSIHHIYHNITTAKKPTFLFEVRRDCISNRYQIICWNEQMAIHACAILSCAVQVGQDTEELTLFVFDFIIFESVEFTQIPVKCSF